MATEVIEGEAVEVEPTRAMVVAQPGQALVVESKDGPAHMIETATRIATALVDIVERQNLYSTISGKKFPKVEAWMTIGRMDNVVAREAERPIRNEDGSYEAFVELLRLSDGMVIGRASALCGTAGDSPWDKRSEPNRRAMAVTRATSRAFRQQYSWIMALAGYEPTPSEEMSDDAPQAPAVAPAARPRPQPTNGDGSLIGTGELAKDFMDFLPKQGPDGYVIAFKLVSKAGGFKVIAKGELAEVLPTIKDQVIGQRVSVWGRVRDETFTKPASKPGGKPYTQTYQVIDLERIKTAEGTLPAPSDEPPDDVKLVGEAETPPLFDDVAVA